MTLLALLGRKAHIDVLEATGALRLASGCLSTFPESLDAVAAAIDAILALCDALPRGEVAG